MKKILFIFAFLSLLSQATKAQTDTIFTNNKTISCNIKETTPDAVKFTYNGEDVVNTIYKNTIQKIVYKSGRVEIFAESSSYKLVKSVDDFENVSLTQVESEILGLYKIGEVSSKARGTTVYSNMEKVKERANKKVKIDAAMMGANIVYITALNTEAAHSGYYSGNTTNTNISGVAYSNTIPNFIEFSKTIGIKKDFTAVQEVSFGSGDSDYSKESSDKTLKINSISNESGVIVINGKLEGFDATSFKVAFFDKSSFTIFLKGKTTTYNFVFKY